jgi:prevent-host-death family protein
MLDPTPDTQPLSAFRDNPTELLNRIQSNEGPVTLTVDGQPVIVLQEASAYQRLLDLAALADAREGIRQGLADAAAGRTRPATEVFAELDREYGVRR